VVLEDAAARQPGERLGHRRDEGEVEDRQIPRSRGRIGEGPHVAVEILVDGQREDVRLVAHPA
jgi:hypothetical protein